MLAPPPPYFSSVAIGSLLLGAVSLTSFKEAVNNFFGV